ncbi:hypothetical protein M8997_013895 [Phyllobacterium sp. 21LDTY02-6]|uniref:hypothetical protein n=1 Tax=Phyllobacterium sp. 21LDTY02-6 TaxID=2944903 RepID=UPI00201FBFCD|nr:hypothetical protein [Phyllobacterium sp. 21LDTY02-6]MCO4318283.1 hypothetical protein [Phyllobacterium sp. 21LDTY02-6]
MSNERRNPLLATAARLALIMGVAVSISGCMGSKTQPYSPNYSYVKMGGAKDNVVRKGYEKEAGAQGVLVPDACITPDTAEYPLYLPSGCSNNLNLQHMVARKQDLMHGREMGPAMAAPAARAAQKYIDGAQVSEQRSRRRYDETTTTSGSGAGL